MREDVYPFTTDDDKTFEVVMCGISYCDGSYEINRLNSEISVIEYIVSGSGTVCEDNKKFTANEGDVYFLKQGRNHLYYSDTENPWVKIWFNFKGNLSDYITKCYGLENKAHFYAPHLREIFEDIIEKAQCASDVNEFFDYMAGRFLKIVQNLSSVSQNNKTKKIPVASVLKEKIDNSLNSDISFDTILSQMFISKCHAIREFKKMYKITPYAYILNQKFETAKSLLTNTALPIGTIAEKLGFCDLQYFSISFKKRFSYTPSEYRKKQIQR